MNMSAQLGTFNEMATDYAGQLQLGIFAEQDRAEMMKKITADQKLQGIEGGKAADGITDQYAKNIKQQQELNKKMEDAVFKGIENALSITNKLGNVTEHLATVFDKLATAANKLLRIIGLGVDDEPTEAEKKAADIMKGAQGTVDQAKLEKDQAFEGASFSQRVLGIGRTDKQKKAQDAYDAAVQQRAEIQQALATEEALTAPAPPSAAGKQALPAGGSQGSGAGQPQIPPGKGVPPDASSGTIKLEDYIKFTDNTGDRAHFDQLNPIIRNSFIEMAKKYFETTGNKLQVNSAFRSAEEQGKVNSGPNPKAAPGMSLHQHGRAVDINSDQRLALEKMGLLGQYGFNPLPGDPPHIFMAKGGIVGARAGGTEIIAGEAGQDEAVIPLEGGGVPVNLNMKPPTSPDTGNLDKIFETGFANLSTAFAKLTDIDVISKTLAQINTRQFGLADAADIVRTEDTQSTASMNDMSGKYERMLADALEKQAAQQEEQSSRMIDALAEMIRAQKDSNSIQERILQTSM